MQLTELTDALNVFWLFFGGVLVFFMQAGFAMVETGLTRAKNAGNIIMKNIMDFVIGSVIYWVIGYGLMYGTGNGFVGVPFGETLMNGQSDAFPYATLFFQTVFCATSATIVSGAMAERTKFSSYLLYSAVISLFIYPIAGHWVWGGGWLSTLGFHDFAGSGLVHMLGGVLAFVGAAVLGPRTGKYTKDGKVNVIPGHNIVITALGVLILWLGWFGFNPASTLSLTDGAWKIAAKVFITTNLSACAAAFVSMMYTWLRYGKPDVSITLNGVLAGLVAVTAACDVITPLAALIIGVIAGILMSAAVSFIDQKIKVDDPVGAISVHGVCGLWGILSVGLFASEGLNGMRGLFYGGGFKLLGIQALGGAALIAWAAALGYILFKVLKHTIGLRVSVEEEDKGLDLTEHGLPNAYPDFQPSYRE